MSNEKIESVEKIKIESGYSIGNRRRLGDIGQNVPAEMKALPNWCAFKTYFDKETGKTKKIILNPADGHWAKPNDGATWTDFESALAFAEANRCAGLSFALKGSGMTCIDLDGCLDERGKKSDLAFDVLKKAGDTYAEKSVSGRGVHVFVKGNFLDGYKNRTSDGALEVYDTDRFISMTGDLISSKKRGAEPLAAAPSELQTLLKEKLGKKSAEHSAAPGVSYKSDAEIIERIRRSKVGGDFNRLYAGENICGDRSRSDLSLMNKLAFFTDRDPAQMERIFRSSGLFRREKGDGYITLTVNTAIKTLVKRPSENYNSGRSKERGSGKSK